MALTDVITGAVSFATSMLRATLAVDVVAILGPGYAPLFAQARPLSATVYEDARLMEHPLEMGSVIADHIVIEPLEIEMACVVTGELAYRSTYAALKAAFTSGTLLTVATRTGSYPSMVITAMPHQERPQSFDAIELNIRLRHAVFVQPQSRAMTTAEVQDAKQSSTTPRGAQQTTPASTPRADAAGNAYATSGAGNASGAAQGSTLYRWAYGQ